MKKGLYKIQCKKHIFMVAITMVAFVFCGCDPALSGDLKIYNESNQTLTVKCSTKLSHDTITSQIQPNSNAAIIVLGGIGDKAMVDCCPCEGKIYTITSPFGAIKKNPALKENWTIANKSKLKTYGGEPVKCELHITQADL